MVEPARANILGVGVSAINMTLALDTIDGWISQGARSYVCVTSVHGIMESQRDESLRRIHNNAGLVTPDGMPLVWLCREQGFRHVGRVYGPDLLLHTCEHQASTGRRHFFYGGADGVAQQLAGVLQDRFPGIGVAGTYSPPFRPLTPEEDDRVVRTINDARPDVVWVGLSTPKQERWMAAHVGRLEVPVLIGVGAAFDFVAGRKKQAPSWMQTRGLEWLFRLATEPRRLWRRYLVNNPAFVISILGQELGLRRYGLSEERLSERVDECGGWMQS